MGLPGLFRMTDSSSCKHKVRCVLKQHLLLLLPSLQETVATDVAKVKDVAKRNASGFCETPRIVVVRLLVCSPLRTISCLLPAGCTHMQDAVQQ
jgi:hypothetical protein